MGYYEKLTIDIQELIESKQYEKAKNLIENELSLPYVPAETEAKLRDYYELIPKDVIFKALSDEDIVLYLKSDPAKQLRAVEELNKRNLRECIDICNEYLSSDGFVNAKVLLIDSLIRQDISEEIHYTNNGLEYTFIPKYVVPVEISLGYTKAIKILSDAYMKEPSKFELAKELVFKECLIALPMNYDEDEGKELADRITNYIEDAFK